MHKNKLCILMDYAEGGKLLFFFKFHLGDLGKVVKQKNKENCLIDEKIIRKWFTQICLAVKYLHEKKILHRDLKIQNVFQTKSGLLKIGDFGIAKKLENASDLAYTSLGTPYYLSPEICENSAYGQPSDIWMLGCILYEMASLDRPFIGDSLSGIIHKITKENPKKLPNFYSEFIQNLVENMLQKKPEKRPTIFEILQNPEIKDEIIKLRKDYPEYNKLFTNTLSFKLKSRSKTPLFMQKSPEKPFAFTPMNKESPQTNKSNKFSENSIFSLIEKARIKKTLLKKDSFEEQKKIELKSYKKFFTKQKISINTANLDPNYICLKKTPEKTSNNKVVTMPNNNDIPTDKVKQKTFSFGDSIFNPKAPISPNRRMLFSEFLKQRLGELRFEKVTNMLKNVEDPIKYLELQKEKILSIIGEENNDCIKVFKFLISCSITPPANVLYNKCGNSGTKSKFMFSPKNKSFNELGEK